MSDTTVHASGNHWKLKATIGTAGIMAVVVFAFMFRLEFGLIALGVGSAWTFYTWTRALMWRENKRLENRQRSAEIMTTELKAMIHHAPNVGVFIAAPAVDDEQAGGIRAGGYNLTFVPATQTERKALPIGDIIDHEPQKPDLLRVMTQEQNAYAVIGAQRTGKSWQCMHFFDQWKRNGHKPFVLGYKEERGEWCGIDKLITDDAQRLDVALRKIIALGRKRARHEQGKTPHPVVLDDWMWFVQNVPFSEYFMSEAGTVLASANIIIYLLVQSDTKDAFGAGKFGAMLKNNYTRLYLEPMLGAGGVVVPGRSRGFLVYPNKKLSERVPVDLIDGKPHCVQADNVLPARLTPKQQECIKLYNQGIVDPKEIAARVYSGRGGNQVYKVRKWLYLYT